MNIIGYVKTAKLKFLEGLIGGNFGKMILLLFLFNTTLTEKDYNEKLYLLNKKEPDQAALYAFLFPGLGYFYLGNPPKGIGHIITTGGMVCLTTYFYKREEGPVWLAHLSLCGLIGMRVYEIFNSYNDTKKYNEDLKQRLEISPKINLIEKSIEVSVLFKL